MSDLHTQGSPEPGPQIDPTLHEGPRSRGWVYLIGAVIVVVVLGTLYAVNAPTSQQASKEAAPQTAGPSGAPQTPISGGRTTGSAPPEQTTNGQGSSANTGGGSSNAGGAPANQGKNANNSAAH
jgi:hypothetical protein